MTTTARARAQQGPRKKKNANPAASTGKKSVRSAFRQSSSRDYVKKLTVEIDRDVHAKLKVIAARKGVTIRDIVGSYLEGYVKENR